MRANSLSFAITTLCLAALGGCASDRATDRSLLFDPAYASPRVEKVLLSEDSLPGRQYWRVAAVMATAPIPALPDAQPSKDPVNAALMAEARKVGADAVINVTYSTGLGFTTGYQMEARGMAVKLVE